MRILQMNWSEISGWETVDGASKLKQANLVLAFGERQAIELPARFAEIKSQFPDAEILSCSSSGDIVGREVVDESIQLTAIQLEKTILRSAQVDIETGGEHFHAGAELAKMLLGPDLKLVFVLADGHNANAGELISGLNSILEDIAPVTGGLAGDGIDFSRTVVGLNETPGPNRAVAVGLYGTDLKVGHGSFGGWTPFGPERIITKSKGNTLYELDGKSALDLYKDYLGERANELPGAALLFPLSLQLGNGEHAVVRTVLSINEKDQSMQFAGDLPIGGKCQLMASSTESLVEAAGIVAEQCLEKGEQHPPELSILISCVGRRILLGQRAEEEIDEAAHTLGAQSCITGFYSYGELSPLGNPNGCQLHNQTMTITTLAEA